MCSRRQRANRCHQHRRCSTLHTEANLWVGLTDCSDHPALRTESETQDKEVWVWTEPSRRSGLMVAASFGFPVPGWPGALPPLRTMNAATWSPGLPGRPAHAQGTCQVVFLSPEGLRKSWLFMRALDTEQTLGPQPRGTWLSCRTSAARSWSPSPAGTRGPCSLHQHHRQGQDGDAHRLT